VARQERFLEVLKELGGSAGNGRLRNQLGWQEDTYERARDALVEAGLVAKGRGRGGSVALVEADRPRARVIDPSRPKIAQPAAKPRAKAARGGFDQTFNALDKVLRNEAGQTTELDYTEQSSWMLFLKYLDDLERQREDIAELKGEAYSSIIDEEHRWGAWAAPKTADGAFDHDRALTGDDLIAYVNDELWPYLQGFKKKASGADTIEYKIGEVFAEIRPKFLSGYSLRDALELIDGLSFGSQAEKHELSSLYEDKIKRMGNAGRNGGEYYTPRPLIRAMIQVVKPQIGERVYDGACGSAGFLCEAYEHMLPLAQSTADRETLQRRTFYGKEKKSLAYVIAIMNMILHGIDAPNILHTNTLSENVLDIQDKNRFDVVLANPPFGGGERPEVQQNFPIRSSETAYLFLQHFMRSLRAGGRAAVVIKNTFLSNTDQAATALRKELLETCDLHTVLDMPEGTFSVPAKTVVLFLEKGRPSKSIWYYQFKPNRTLGKTTPLTNSDLVDFLEGVPLRATSDVSWTINVAGVATEDADLSVQNPSDRGYEAVDIAAALGVLDRLEGRATLVEADVRRLATDLKPSSAAGQPVQLGDVCWIANGLVDPKDDAYADMIHVGGGNIESGTGRLLNLQTAREEKLISGKYLFPSDVVLYSKIRPYLRKVARPEFEGLCSADVYPLSFDSSILDRGFLFHLLIGHSFTEYAIRGSARVGMPKVNQDHLFAYAFKLPPLAEQARISTYLDQVAGRGQELAHIRQKQLTALKILSEGVAFAALEPTTA
jgi:type I restriction enzyme M protein